jgi:FkbM family methyltransferase
MPSYYLSHPTCQILSLGPLYERFLGTRNNGTFVEVGGYDGISFSNTWGLAEKNWKGFLVEPIPEYAALARHSHRRHPGVHVLEYAIGSENGIVEMYLADTLTSSSPEMIEEYRQMKWVKGSKETNVVAVPLMTLDDCLLSIGVEPGFDVLVVDVEGREPEVFTGFSLGTWHPKMMIVEIADAHPLLRNSARADSHLSQHIIESKYNIVYKDHINTVFVRTDVYEGAMNQA